MKRDDEDIEEMENEGESQDPSSAAGSLPEEPLADSDYKVQDMNDAEITHHLGGIYQKWFLEYASSVIVDRAVPYLEDGLKPVHRRILYTMGKLENGHHKKVANIVGQVMAYHPHGDAGIYGALITLGQQNLLIDTQGNWGNIFTGEGAAAGRYIEAHLTNLARDILFNDKITEWKSSYDGTDKEPVFLPVKFPLLLTQGILGVAVGLQSLILPHNFCELIEASIKYLKGEDFEIFPDFLTGGMIDVSKYNDGKQGGMVRVRSHIEKEDNKTLVIKDLAHGVTNRQLKASIEAAIDKGKINIKKIEDLTSMEVRIVLTLADKVSPDKTIDALYAFTDCEKKIYTNCCVVEADETGKKTPIFIGVSDALKHSTDRTVNLIRKELEVQLGELKEKLNYCSLEKIFIEERIYKDKEFENAPSVAVAIEHTTKRLQPFLNLLVRDLTEDDVARLMEIRMKRILKYSKDDADKIIANLKKSIKEIEHKLKHMVETTIEWFEGLMAKYGAEHPRLTEIRTFDNVVATKVVEANEKLYINREQGYVGYELKKDEYICPCSTIDDILVIYKDGTYKITKVKEKDYVGKNILYVNVYKKNDKRMVYNVVYRDGKGGPSYMKRFAITGVTRDKEYDITAGTPGSKILYFTANSNAEAESIHVDLKPRYKMKVGVLDRDFAEISIKNKNAKGILLTKNEILKISLKKRGASTMGGRKVWFDTTIQRLNYEGHGEFLGEFQSEDKILYITKNGEYNFTGFEDSVHFPENLLRLEKFKADKVWTVCLYDANEKYAYVKRFVFESTSKQVSFLGDNPKSELIHITDTAFPRLEVTFGGADAEREKLEIDAEEFIGVKGIKAKGKRISQYKVESVLELEPTRFPEPEPEEDAEETEEAEPIVDADDDNSDDKGGNDESGQLTLF
ncbi:MAG: DNA gyrase/topoisomerase IV subunit A [Paludibacteraceae bacterium]|nr:DNA gyrase/topoisomerase IV subunit A [Paludibacteraceae bacterium]